MRHLKPSSSDGLRRENFRFGGCAAADIVTLRPMVDASNHLCDGKLRHNADGRWEAFSSNAYWRRNYAKMHAADQEIIHLVSHFFHTAFNDRPRARRAIDVGSGTNLYPSLLMLPWTEQILLTDHSENNIRWLRRQVADERTSWSWLRFWHIGWLRRTSWSWQPFWREMRDFEGYSRIGKPRVRLRQACTGSPGHAGIKRCSVFELPAAQWQLGTMFFVAESITEDAEEFRAAIHGFVGALQPHSPFAAAFMAGSHGYSVDGKSFPAFSITPDDVTEQFKNLGVSELSVDLLKTTDRIREGYEGMIVATGIVGG
jgi:hypothetical protein